MEKVAKISSFSSATITTEQFVSKMTPSLDIEKEAEISASVNSGTTRNLDTAQKRGSAILDLKCVDAQTGLMGKTLIELQSNKGDVLPAHKFGTHDFVILIPNKADLGSPPLGQGVVYGLKDSSITVPFDDILEKVVNEIGTSNLSLISLSKPFNNYIGFQDV